MGDLVQLIQLLSDGTVPVQGEGLGLEAHKQLRDVDKKKEKKFSGVIPAAS